MKKFLSFIMCICLLVGICAVAHATDVDKIRPDGPPIGYPSTGNTNNQYVYVYTTPDGTTVVIPYYGPIYEDVNTNNTTNQTKEEQTQEEKKEEEKQEEKQEDEKTEEEKKTDENLPIKTAALIEEIFKLINEERTKANLNALNYNMELQHPVDTRVVESAAQFSHTRPNGTSCFTVVQDLDYNCVGENLVKADNAIATAQRLVKCWMDSEGHRANILNPDFTETAIGVFITDDITYAAQLFMG